MGGTKEAIQSRFEVVEAAGNRIKHTACDSEFYNTETIYFLQSKKGSTLAIVADKVIWQSLCLFFGIYTEIKKTYYVTIY